MRDQNLSPCLVPLSNCGFPIAWFEFYYPKDVTLTVNYVINHLSNHYLIELLALFLNTAFFIFVLRSLRQLYHRLRSQ